MAASKTMLGKSASKRSSLMAGNNVTGETFKAEVLDSRVPVLVDFYADWCGACRAMNPTLVELTGEANGRYKVVKVDADAERELSNDYQVRALPTLFVVKDGDVKAKLVGLQNKARLVEALALEGGP
jgi:thioredoxin 1